MQVVGNRKLICFFILLSACTIAFGQTKSTSNYFDRIIQTNKHQIIIDHQSIVPVKKHQKPIFCRLEDYMEDQSGVAIRFRLGTLNYVNYLEYNIPYFY